MPRRCGSSSGEAHSRFVIRQSSLKMVRSPEQQGVRCLRHREGILSRRGTASARRLIFPGAGPGLSRPLSPWPDGDGIVAAASTIALRAHGG